MRKKILAFVMFFLAVLFVASCNGQKPEDHSSDKRYNVYLMAKDSGYKGSYEEWLDSISGREVVLEVSGDKLVWRYSNESTSEARVLIDLSTLQGEKGDKGDKGDTGAKGDKGDTGAKGDTGEKGASAYEIYKKYHPDYTGTEEDWINSLIPTIEIGPNGNWFINGVDTGKPSVVNNGGNGSQGQEGNNTVSVDFYAFNDTHGNLQDTSGKGLGIAKITTLLNELTEGKNSVLIHQGDMWQGSVESNNTHGLFGTEWLKQQGFVSMTVGNHEFDWGVDKIIENKETFNFPILGINVVDKVTREKVDYLDSSIIVERDGLKIGIIGAIGNCLSSISASNVPGIDFATGAELTNMVMAESAKLRNDGCDFIVYSLHGSPLMDNDEAYDMSLSTNHYVDLVLEGHTHTRYAEKDEGGVYHIQTEGYNKSFYKIALTYDFTSKEYTVTPTVYETDYNSPYSTYKEDENVLALFEKYKSYYDSAYRILGENDTFRSSDYLKNLCSVLYYQTGIEKWGKDYNIILGGGYTSCRGSGLYEGTVTYASISGLFPFNNDIVLCSVKGSDLKNTQFIKGSSNYYVTWSDYGNSIKANIQDDEIYYLVTDTYNSDYASNHLTVIDRLQDGGMYARDLLAKFVENGGLAGQKLEHQGTANDPYSVKDAYDYASVSTNTDAKLGFYKGYVKDLSEAIFKDGYIQNVILEDETGTYTIKAYRIYYYDGVTSKEFGFNQNNIKVGDLITFYGGANYYGNAAQFNGSNIAIKINDTVTNDGSNSDAPLTTIQYNFNSLFGFESKADFYVVGTVTYKYDENIYILSSAIDMGSDLWLPSFKRYVSENSDEASLFDEIVIKYSFETDSYSVERIIAKASGDGTVTNPGSVSDAIRLAKLYKGSHPRLAGADEPYYFVGKVKTAASGIGSGYLRNVYIEDLNDPNVSIYIYNLQKNEAMNPNFENTTDLAVGDIIVIYGTPFTYTNGTQEFTTGTYVYSINGVLTAE